MAQGMDDKIRQISDMLGSREAQEGIRQLLNSLSSSDEPNRTDIGSQSAEGNDPELSFSDAPRTTPHQESDWIYNIQNMLGQMSNIQDSRINLLRSVHPFLNPTRKERCNTCINILKIAEIVKAFTNNGGRLI